MDLHKRWLLAHFLDSFLQCMAQHKNVPFVFLLVFTVYRRDGGQRLMRQAEDMPQRATETIVVNNKSLRLQTRNVSQNSTDTALKWQGKTMPR